MGLEVNKAWLDAADKAAMAADLFYCMELLKATFQNRQQSFEIAPFSSLYKFVLHHFHHFTKSVFLLSGSEATGVVCVPGSGFKQKPNTFHLRMTILPSEELLEGVIERWTTFHAQWREKYFGAAVQEVSV